MNKEKIKITDSSMLKEFGFRKHKQDDDDVLTSKLTRNWVDADTVDGYEIGGSGWEFYPLMKVKNNMELKVYAF